MNEFFANIDWSEILQASIDTFWMLGGSLLFTIILGLPLGVLLFLCGPKQMFEQRGVYALLSLVVNILRSLPFIILLIVMIPITVLITGTGSTEADGLNLFRVNRFYDVKFHFSLLD